MRRQMGVSPGRCRPDKQKEKGQPGLNLGKCRTAPAAAAALNKVENPEKGILLRQWPLSRSIRREQLFLHLFRPVLFMMIFFVVHYLAYSIHIFIYLFSCIFPLFRPLLLLPVMDTSQVYKNFLIWT